MKRNTLFKTALAFFTGAVLMAAGDIQATLINIDSAGTNITNKNGNANGPLMLVPLAWQGGAHAPSSSNAATRLDWLDNVDTYQPGQVAGYNAITSSSLGQPGASEISDDTAAGNPLGYTLTAGFGYYVTAHYGGSYVAWYLSSVVVGDTYQVPDSIGDVTGATAYAALEPPINGNYNPNQGLSNVRIWRGEETDTVPEGGASVALLGLALAGLGAARRFIKKA